MESDQMRTNRNLDDELQVLLKAGAEPGAPFQRIQVGLSELPLSVPSGSLAKGQLRKPKELSFGTLVFKQTESRQLLPRRFLRASGKGAFLSGDCPEEMSVQYFEGPLYEVEELTLSGIKLTFRSPDSWGLRKSWLQSFFPV
jgi:hypothetical protein